MKYVFLYSKNIIFIFVSIFFLNSSFGSTQACYDLINSNNLNVSDSSISWRDRVLEAYRTHDDEMLAYSLIQHVLQKTPNMDKSEKRELKKIAQQIILGSIETGIENKASYKKILLKFLHFLGVSPIFIQDKFKKDRLVSKQILTTLTNTLFFTFGPTLFSTINSSPIYDYKRSVDYIIDLSMRDILYENDLDAWVVGQRLRKVIFEYSKKTTSWTAGRRYLPWLIVLSVFLTTEYTPFKWAQELTKDSLPYAYNPYKTQEFMQDINQNVANLKVGKSLIIYDKHLFTEIDYRQNPLKAFENLENNFSKDFDSINVEKLEELSYLDLSKYDNVVIFSHGFPDYINLGFNLNSEYKMKSGAKLIFLSCLVGQKGGGPSKEQWIQFSKKLMLEDGKAISSTQTIRLDGYNPESAGPVKQGFKSYVFQKYIADEIFELTGQGSGLYQLAEVGLNIYMAISNEYYFSPKGIRVYDVKTNTDKFVPSSKPKNKQ